MTYKPDVDLKIPGPPQGIKAIPWRLPIWLYRLRLGGLLGHRFLLLTHIGRVSGQPRTAVLEVVKYNPKTNTHFVASGFGEKSQWFQNITVTPEVTIQVGNNSFLAVAERLPVDEAEEIFRDYHNRHPNAIKNLGKLIGYNIGDDEEKLITFMRTIPIVAFFPK